MRPPPASGLAAVVALVAVSIAYVVFRNGGWVYDDNLILGIAHRIGFGWTWLDHPIFQHWDIGMNAAYSALLAVFPIDYRWGLVAMLLVLAAAILVFERVVGLVLGRGWLSVTAAAWFGLSILWARQLQWWAAGVQELPTLLCDLLCLYGYLRFVADRQSRWVVCSAAALAVGLLFYEKPALMPVYLALVGILLMSDRVTVRSTLLMFWRERRIWIAYVVVLGMWAFGYLSSGALNGAKFGHVGPSQYVSYFRIMWLNTLAPALAGFTLPPANLDPIQTVGAVSVQLVLALLLLVSIRRKPSAWRAWLFLALTVAIDGAIVAHARVGLFGVTTANDLRYLTDFAWLVPFAVCVAFSRDRLLTPKPSARLAQTGCRRATMPLILGGASVFAAYAAGSVATASHLQATWDSTSARHWEANIERGFNALSAPPGGVVVADQQVPFDVVSSAFAPLNQLSYVLPLYAPGFRVGGPLTGPLVTVTTTGNVLPATIATSTPTTVDRRLPLSDHVRLSSPRGRFQAGACVAPSPTPLRLQLTPQAGAPSAGPFFLILHYSTPQPAELPLLVDTKRGERSQSVIVAPYAHSSLAWLGSEPVRRVELLLAAHTALCLRPSAVVTLREATRAPS
jgi:hypothetical protein